MTRRYNSNLVNYQSPAFGVGFDEGRAGNPRLNEPADPEMSEVEWSSYCEGWLMGSCEAPTTPTALSPQPMRGHKECARVQTDSRTITE